MGNRRQGGKAEQLEGHRTIETWGKHNKKQAIVKNLPEPPLVVLQGTVPVASDSHVMPFKYRICLTMLLDIYVLVINLNFAILVHVNALF